MSSRPTYEVFLSFRGMDTRNYFAKCLHLLLKKDGVDAFIDKENLEKGKDTNNELINAINQSMISIPIISEGYASSNSCLMELEHMLKRIDEKNHIVIPIFFYVNPSDVRECKGPFDLSLLWCKDGHNDRHIDDTIIGSWESALKRVGGMNGYHLREENEVEHIEIIEQIILNVRRKLKKEDLLPGELVGVDPHVKRIMGMLDVDYRNGQASKIGDAHKKVLLIHGLAGVGKTALAKHVYNQLHHLFDACSFLGEISYEIEQHGVLSVQNKLISHLHRNGKKYDCSDQALIHIGSRFATMKVLVLFDGVESHEQLCQLVRELDWLGTGSRVILTSQRQDVLGKINGVKCFHLEPMKQDKALILFCKKAFGTDSPRKELRELPADIVAATGGFPAVLEIVGFSLLNATSEEEWQETLTELKKGRNEGVKAALKKSYSNLNAEEQQIFLDIACFFIGMNKRNPYYMWQDYMNSPSRSIRTLIARSLIEIGEDKELRMHEILKKFGCAIVEDESPQLCERSRLWKHKEALDVLKSEKGTDKVKALRLEFGGGFVEHIRCDYFNGLKNLRFLKLDRADIQGDFRNCFSSLRWLDWQGGPKILDVQSQDLNMQNLVILDLSGSQVDQGWRGWDLLQQAKKLKVLKVIRCFRLIATPNFPAPMELERLILEGCHNLGFIKPSIGFLDKLVFLNMKQCNRLNELPNLGPMKGLEELVIDGTSISQINFQEGSMDKLKTLSARDCKCLIKLSNSIGYLESLECLALDGTGIQTLPESIGSMKELKTLSLKNCGGLTHLPNGIGKLKSLQFLDLSHTAIRELPPIEDWKAMKVLRMKLTFIEEFPEALLNLEMLEEIDFSSCPRLKGCIQDLAIGKLSSLTILKLSHTQIRCQPESFHCLPLLRELDIVGCDIFQRPPQSPSSSINVPLDSDLSTLEPHVMNEGVGEKRRREEREREREGLGEREGNLEKMWGKRPRLQ